MGGTRLVRAVVAVGISIGALAACGDDDATDATGTPSDRQIRSISDEVRPQDPSAAEALAALGLSDLPGLPADEVARVQDERERESWYADGPAGVHASHEHDDDAALAALAALDPDQRAELDAQLERARRAAQRYPTVADARAAGYLPIGPAVPGLGVHMVQLRYQADADFHLDWPGVLMYQDTRPDAPVVGMLYLTRAINPPEGFVGDVDQWHEHLKVCIREGDDEIEIVSVDDVELTKDSCDDAGGVFFGESGWMLHVWPLEGWVPPEGPFSDDNSLVQPRA